MLNVVPTPVTVAERVEVVIVPVLDVLGQAEALQFPVATDTMVAEKVKEFFARNKIRNVQNLKKGKLDFMVISNYTLTRDRLLIKNPGSKQDRGQRWDNMNAKLLQNSGEKLQYSQISVIWQVNFLKYFSNIELKSFVTRKTPAIVHAKICFGEFVKFDS